MTKPIIYHIPVCPFSQRIQILLALKGIPDAIDFETVDITQPRNPSLLTKARGSSALPVLELEDGRILKESLVILGYVDDAYPAKRVARDDPYERAVEALMIVQEREFTNTGYSLLMNQNATKRDELRASMDLRYKQLDEFLEWQASDRTFLFEGFGLAETIFTPILQRFWFLEYYEGYQPPTSCNRVRRWRDACCDHPAAQQVSREQIIKMYYDYSMGVGNGMVPAGRTRSSFAPNPPWHERPWPSRKTYGRCASDAELGLL